MNLETKLNLFSVGRKRSHKFVPNVLSKIAVYLVSIISAFSYLGCEPEKKTSNDEPSSEYECGVNFDCPDTQVCYKNECVDPPIKYYGGKTVEETWTQFNQVLQKDGLEEAIKFFDPVTKKKYLALLQTQNLSTLAAQLSGTFPTNCTTGEYFKQCDIQINGSFEPIQFMYVEENEESIWKIRNF